MWHPLVQWQKQKWNEHWSSIQFTSQIVELLWTHPKTQSQKARLVCFLLFNITFEVKLFPWSFYLQNHIKNWTSYQFRKKYTIWTTVLISLKQSSWTNQKLYNKTYFQNQQLKTNLIIFNILLVIFHTFLHSSIIITIILAFVAITITIIIASSWYVIGKHFDCIFRKNKRICCDTSLRPHPTIVTIPRKQIVSLLWE